MITTRDLDHASYLTLLYKVLRGAEVEKTGIYLDSNGYPTIGLGFVLNSSKATKEGLDAIFSALGFKDKATPSPQVSQSDIDIDKDYRAQL